jgi:hypothetical protein
MIRIALEEEFMVGLDHGSVGLRSRDPGLRYLSLELAFATKLNRNHPSQCGYHRWQNDEHSSGHNQAPIGSTRHSRLALLRS